MARYAALMVDALALCQFPFLGVLEVPRVNKAFIGPRPRVIRPIGFRCFCALLQADVGRLATWGGAVVYRSATTSP